MTIGQRIRAKREEKNMRSTELASKIHSSKQSIYKYENDIITNIPSNVIEALANALETTPAFLMGWEDEKGNIIETDKPNSDFQERALMMYARYQKLNPEVKIAVDALLKLHQQDS